MRTPHLQLAIDCAVELAPETDAELARALLENDLNAAGRLYDRYATNVRGMVHRLVGPDAELDDIVQDVFLTAISSIAKLREPSLLKSWLLGIAVGKARDNLRSRWRRRWLSFLPDEELHERAAPTREPPLDVATEVCSILNQLPPEERIALLLCRLEGLSLEEAAGSCRMTVSTFKRRLARAQTKFIARARRRPALGPWLPAKAREPAPGARSS